MKTLTIAGAAVVLFAAAAVAEKVETFTFEDLSSGSLDAKGQTDKGLTGRALPRAGGCFRRDGYSGEPKVVLAECCVYPGLGTNVPPWAANVALSGAWGCQTAGLRSTDTLSKGRFKSTYLVLAKDIVDIDFDSLAVESITDASGRDYAKKPNGEPNWSVDDYRSSVDHASGFAMFVLTGGGDGWATSLPRVKGTVKILVAGETTTKEIAGKVSAGVVGSGDFSYTVKLARSAFMDDGKHLKVVPVKARANDEIEVFCGGKKLDTKGVSSINGEKSYTFGPPSADDIVIKVSYPDGVKELVLPF